MRTFDTVLTPGTRLVWTFPDGRRIRLERSGQASELDWRRERARAFFRDDFLGRGRRTTGT